MVFSLYKSTRITNFEKSQAALVNDYFSLIEAQFKDCIEKNYRNTCYGGGILKKDTQCNFSVPYPLVNKALIEGKLQQESYKILGKGLHYNFFTLQKDQTTFVYDCIDGAD